MTRETFKQTGSSIELLDGASEIIDFQTEASINDNLPHNGLFFVSKNASAIFEIYLDQTSTSTTPDFVIQGKGTLVIETDDGIRFSTLRIRNNSGATTAAGDAQYRISTAKRITVFENG